MADAFLHQSLSQQQTLAPQMRKSLEILQASTLELSQLVQQALETNPVLEDITENISLDDEGSEADEGDSLDYMNQTDDDWRPHDPRRKKFTLDQRRRRTTPANLRLHRSTGDTPAASAASTRPIDGRS
jgi:RNA polymerase sigma-54 factor